MYSPFVKKTPLSTSKSHSRNFSPYTSASRSMTPRNQSVNRSYNYSFIMETSSHILECYGSPLPVLVTEAIYSADRIEDVSVKLEPFGYASLVCGRQLLIWNYKLGTDMKTVIHCKELTLPPSDLAHKAELVHLFQTENSVLPSALAVSPEGHVRYWPNINHEGSSVDAITDLQGQECYSLTSIFPFGCILATTTCSLVLITPTIGEGQPNVICRTLKMPQGVLASIGRKVSSFIFGVVPAQSSEMKQLNRVLSFKDKNDEQFLYVLSSNTFQKWYIAKDSSDQLLYEVDLDRQLKQHFIDALFKSDSCLMPNFKAWCLDMQLTESGVMLLTAGAATSRSEGNVCYAFGLLLTTSELPPQNLATFQLIEHFENYQEETEEHLLSYKFILPSLHSQIGYIYNTEKIMCIQIDSSSEADEIDVKSSSGVILGSGTCDDIPLFFTTNYGIVSFSANPTPITDTSMILSSIKDVSIQETDPKEPPESLSSKLRSAMCSYCNGDMGKCQSLINEINTNINMPIKNTEFDKAVIKLSEGIIDDYPVSDPRWCESVPSGSVSSSLIISYQLDDKLKAHEYLLNFLKVFDLLQKLSTSKVGDVIIPTNLLLCEHAEKLIAAKAIRLFLNDHKEVIEIAIQEALHRREVEVKNHLTPQDVFFREVSKIDSIFPAFLSWEEEELLEDENMSKILNVVMTINKIFLGILDSVLEYRLSKIDNYNLQETNSNAEFLPWTAREGNFGLRDHLRKQLSINLNNTLTISSNIQIQGVLFQQYVDLLNIFLNGYKCHLESLSSQQESLKKKYEQERNQLIMPLLHVEQYERAAAIAEKYLDFDILVRICEETQNGEKLQRYMLQFSEQNFSNFVFKWYLDKGKRAKLFDKRLGQTEALGEFLQHHEDLKWLHYIRENQYNLAYSTLKELALKETRFLNKKKTLLSLSKLCCLISNVPNDVKSNQISALNLEQDLITHQEALPLATVQAYGIDPRNMRVFQSEELIEMYISDENSSANAYDFKIALDLLHFVKKAPDDPDLYNLRMRIWAKAILRDSWEEMDVNNPLEAIKDTIFFQVIELAFDQGLDMQSFIPPIDDLLVLPELAEVIDSPSFTFLLRAGYEYLSKIID